MTDTIDQTPDRGEQPIVYIREVAVADLPEEVQDRVQGLETIYAIGGENGERIALVKDRELAFVVARQNQLTPMSVH